MTLFTFHTTPAIVSGPGSVTRLADLGPAVLGRRILLVTDKGLLAAKLIDPVIEALRAAGCSVWVYDAVDAEPPEKNALEAAAAAQAFDATGVLGFGGGSPMDVAKIAALLAGSRETLTMAYGVGNATGPRLPLVLVPTTAGTGSEVTPIAILTTGEAEKKGVVSPLLLPDLAVLDADLTLGLPPHVTAATGIDAMVHAIEAFVSVSSNNNPLSRMLAKQALCLLGANIRATVFCGGERAARSNMLLGSMLAGQAFANSPVAAVHALAYPIGSLFHVPHGLSNALVLPHVLRFNLPRALDQYAEIAPCVFPELEGRTVEERANGLIEGLERLSREIGLQQRLREVGISEDDLPILAREAMKQTRLLVNNPRELTEADACTIYREAW